MNKHQLENELATSAKLPLSTSVKAIDGLIKIVSACLERGEEISIRGFGSLFVVEKAERMGRNPQTGKEQLIPAHRVAVFRASQNLKESLNK